MSKIIKNKQSPPSDPASDADDEIRDGMSNMNLSDSEGEPEELEEDEASDVEEHSDDDISDDDDSSGSKISFRIEATRLRSILQCFKEVASDTFFYFTSDGVVMFPQNFSKGEEKKNKRKDRDDLIYHDPRIVFHLNSENIIYQYNLSSEYNFICFPTATIISCIKKCGKKDVLDIFINEEEPEIMNYSVSQGSSSMYGVTNMRGRSVADDIYEPLDLSNFSQEIKASYICGDGEYKMLMGFIGGGTAKIPSNCIFSVKGTGFLVQSKYTNSSSSLNLGNANLKKRGVDFRWSSSTITAMKKLQGIDGICSFRYHSDSVLSIEKKIATTGNLTFLFSSA